MISSAMLYVGSAIVIAWGIAHIAIPTKNIVDGFGPITPDNRRIILMEWLMEGVLLVFIGVLVASVTMLAAESERSAMVVYRVAAIALAVMAGVSQFTGARTAILPMKLCPAIFLTAAALIFFATVF